MPKFDKNPEFRILKTRIKSSIPKVDRVLRPGGVIAVFGYQFHEPVGCAGAEEFTALRKSVFEGGVFAESWDPRAKHVFEGEYRTIPQLIYEEKERFVGVKTKYSASRF